MVDWAFEDALATIQSLPSIPTLVLHSADGICLGDIRFAKIHTTLQMHAVLLTVLEKWVENGNFNPENMAEANYSHSTAIMVALYPDALLNDRERGNRDDCSPVQSATWTGIFHSSVN